MHVVSLCFTFVCKFYEISGTVFNSQSGHKYTVEMAIFNIYYVQKAETPKTGWPELRFMCSARGL